MNENMKQTNKINETKKLDIKLVYLKYFSFSVVINQELICHKFGADFKNGVV